MKAPNKGMTVSFPGILQSDKCMQMIGKGMEVRSGECLNHDSQDLTISMMVKSNLVNHIITRIEVQTKSEKQEKRERFPDQARNDLSRAEHKMSSHNGGKGVPKRLRHKLSHKAAQTMSSQLTNE